MSYEFERSLLDQVEAEILRLRDDLNARQGVGFERGTQLFEKVTVTKVMIENLTVSAPNGLITVDVKVEIAGGRQSVVVLHEGHPIGAVAEREATATGKTLVKVTFTPRSLAGLANSGSAYVIDTYPVLLEQNVAELTREATNASGGLNRPFTTYNTLVAYGIEEALREAKVRSPYTAGAIRGIIDDQVRTRSMGRNLLPMGQSGIPLEYMRPDILESLRVLERAANESSGYLDRAIVRNVIDILRRGAR